MRIPRVCLAGALACMTIGFGCRRGEPAAGPMNMPAAESPSASVGLSDDQKAAIQRMQTTGAGMELDGAGFPVEIDLASERVFADEELVRAALMFPNLKRLRLAVSSVSTATLAELASLTALEELYLQDAAIDDAGLATLLRSMPNLRRLTLRRVQGVTDEALNAVAACKNLEVAALIELNQLTGAGLQPLAGIPRLRSLDLRNCGRLAAEDFKRLAAFDDLVELKLAGPAVNDAVAEAIVDLPQVRSLTIEDAEISATFLERLASDKATAERLQTLALARCFGVTDEALASIDKFPNLETLSLRDIMASGEFLARLSEAGKGPLALKTLIATNTFLDDGAVEHLPKLTPKLERLDLRGNPGITDQSRSAFAKLKHLKDLEPH